MEDFPLYHWSPKDRRKEISKRGFMPGSRSVDNQWKPPFICFASDPELAWSLSGGIHQEIEDWDLWVMWSSTPDGYEEIKDHYPDTHREYVKEYRVYERVFKRDIWFAGTRAQAGEKA